MGKGFEGLSHKHREGLIGGVSAGFFFVLVGAIFVITPNLFGKIIDFINDFRLRSVPNLGGIVWPAPASPFTHSVVYVAVEQFSYVWGLFQIVVLALRLAIGSPVNKTAETVSNIVFSFGTGFLVRSFLIETVRFPLVSGLTRWFAFWAVIIILLGASLIIRGVILAAASMRRAT